MQRGLASIISLSGFALSGLLAAIVLPSCSSGTATPGADGGASGGCVAYATPTGFDLMNPPAKLRANVMPLFDQSCSFSSCHGFASSPKGNLFLGSQAHMAADATLVRTNLLGVMSGENPTMAYVKAGDPANSFMMHKIDGNQCTLESTCTKPDGCQESMPQGLDILPVDQRDILRRWIAQGALDN